MEYIVTGIIVAVIGAIVWLVHDLADRGTNIVTELEKRDAEQVKVANERLSEIIANAAKTTSDNEVRMRLLLALTRLKK